MLFGLRTLGRNHIASGGEVQTIHTKQERFALLPRQKGEHTVPSEGSQEAGLDTRPRRQVYVSD